MRPIDADALMESIGCADAVKYGNRDRAQQDTSYSTMMLYEIRNEIDAQPTVGGWISVKDRLPEDGEMVIVAIFGHDVIVQHEGETLEMAINRTLQHKRVTVGFLDEEGFWYGADGYPMIVQPSYWMPLPEPPKEVDDDGSRPAAGD